MPLCSNPILLFLYSPTAEQTTQFGKSPPPRNVPQDQTWDLQLLQNFIFKCLKTFFGGKKRIPLLLGYLTGR